MNCIQHEDGVAVEPGMLEYIAIRELAAEEGDEGEPGEFQAQRGNQGFVTDQLRSKKRLGARLGLIAVRARIRGQFADELRNICSTKMLLRLEKLRQGDEGGVPDDGPFEAAAGVDDAGQRGEEAVMVEGDGGIERPGKRAGQSAPELEAVLGNKGGGFHGHDLGVDGYDLGGEDFDGVVADLVGVFSGVGAEGDGPDKRQPTGRSFGEEAL